MALNTLARIGTEPAALELPKDVELSLAGYIERCYSESREAKQRITERLLKCERQRQGEYESDRKAKIAETGGSEVFLMLTDIKCRAAESWIKDVMLSAGESPWKVDPTSLPEVNPEDVANIQQVVYAEAMALQQQGIEVPPEAIEARKRQVQDEYLRRIRESAEYSAGRMQNKIEDILQEASWNMTFQDVIYDFVTFPYCIIGGPLVRMRQSLKWGHGWTPVVTNEACREFERVPPHDVFWSAASTNPQEGYFIRRHRMMPADIVRLKNLPGYNNAEIDAALMQYRGGLTNIQYGDSQRQDITGINLMHVMNHTIEGIEFWGDVLGYMLNEWGMNVDPNEIYPICAWKIGSHVILAKINTNPLGFRPYEKACFENVPGSWAGKALPELMSDVQEISNGAARAIHNNMSIASGPQVEVQIDRLPAGEKITKMYPWKIWQTQADRTGSGQPAIRFFQPDMNAGPLLEVLQYFTRLADEVTGVPNYIYGNAQSSGAGRTASGLSMLMDNASKGIKQAILALDRAMAGLLTNLYYDLMIKDPDHSIKGDMKIVPSGIVGALIKDHIQEKRQLFFQTVSNPIDTQIIGIKGRAELIRQLAKGLSIDVTKVLPSDEQLDQLQQQSGDPQAQQMVAELQTQVQQLLQQLNDKTEELNVRREEINGRVEAARIAASANVESRTHENEVRARVDSETKIHATEIDRETRLEIAQMREETERMKIDSSHQIETRRADNEINNTPEQPDIEQQIEQLLNRSLDPIMKRIEQLTAKEKEPASDKPPVVVNLQVDAKSGEVKKSVKFKTDKSGNIIGADVEEK